MSTSRVPPEPIRMLTSTSSAGFISFNEPPAVTSLMIYFATAEEAYVRLGSDGGIEIGKGYTPEAAALTFWTGIAVNNPMRARVQVLEMHLRAALLDAPSWRERATATLEERARCTLHPDCRECTGLAESCWDSVLIRSVAKEEG